MDQCQGRIHDSQGYLSNQCSRKAVNTEDGKGWCRQHTPSVVKARRDKWDAKWKTEWEEGARRREVENRFADANLRKLALYPRLVEALRECRDALKMSTERTLSWPRTLGTANDLLAEADEVE